MNVHTLIAHFRSALGSVRQLLRAHFNRFARLYWIIWAMCFGLSILSTILMTVIIIAALFFDLSDVINIKLYKLLVIAILISWTGIVFVVWNVRRIWNLSERLKWQTTKLAHPRQSKQRRDLEARLKSMV